MMNQRDFDLTCETVETEMPELVKEFRALGAVECYEYNPEIVEIISDLGAYGLWFAAQEAQEVGNEPMLNLIALASLKGIARNAYLNYMSFEDKAIIDRINNLYDPANSAFTYVYAGLAQNDVNSL